MDNLEVTKAQTYKSVKIITITDKDDNALKESLAKQFESIEIVAITTDKPLCTNSILKYFEGSDIVLIISQDSESALEIATNLGRYSYVHRKSLTIGAVIKASPFDSSDWENNRYTQIYCFKNYIDSIFVITKDGLFRLIKDISYMLVKPCLVSLNLEDLKSIFCDSEYSIMGIGIASGTGAVEKAVKLP